jgi:hypothetical protein
MAALSASDFFKEPTSVRPDRKLLILKKYKAEEAFQMADGKLVVFKYEKSVYDKISALSPGDNNGYNSILLKDTQGKTYKLNKIGKSKEFGGGGSGSGGGAENTKNNESSVCLWSAVYKVFGKADVSTVIKNYNNPKVKALYDVDETEKNMISQTDELWLNHYERTAKFLVDGLFKQGDYIFHRGGPFVAKIYKKFSQLNKLLSVPFANANKWNPADIWVSKKGFDLEGLDDCQTIDCLNRYILNALKDRTLVGISLKKTENRIRQTNFNVGEKRPPMKWNGYRVAAKGKGIFGSKDVYVYGKGEDEVEMQVRSFDDLSGYQGEIIGKKAKYGKIAHGPINVVLSDLNLPTLPPQQTIVAKARNKDKVLIKELYKMFKKYDEPGVSEENFIKIVTSKDTKSDWLFSKYLGVKLIDILMSATPSTKRDGFVQGAIGYALSNSKNSSAFIKISE